MTTHGCATCGAVTSNDGEFHPHVFCVLKQAYPSRVPWDVFRETAARLGVDLPLEPPLIRDLPLDREPEPERSLTR